MSSATKLSDQLNSTIKYKISVQLQDLPIKTLLSIIYSGTINNTQEVLLVNK